MCGLTKKENSLDSVDNDILGFRQKNTNNVM